MYRRDGVFDRYAYGRAGQSFFRAAQFKAIRSGSRRRAPTRIAPDILLITPHSTEPDLSTLEGCKMPPQVSIHQEYPAYVFAHERSGGSFESKDLLRIIRTRRLGGNAADLPK
jgi:hypothetical protein